MKLNERRPLLRKVLFCLLMISIASSAGYFLYKDLTWVQGKGRGPVMAQLESFQPTVRRKLSSSYLWSAVREGLEIHKNDSIQVGMGGSALLRLKDKSLLEIDENSLVVVDSKSALKLNFLKGTFILRDTSGDKKITVKKGKKKIERLKIRLEKPRLGRRLFTLKEQPVPVTFEWRIEKSGENKQPSLQVSKDRRFRKAFTKTLPIEGGGKTLAFKTGKYFWRMKDGDVPVTEVRSFEVHEVEAIHPSWPKDTRIEQWRKGSAVSFRWAIPRALSHLPKAFQKEKVRHEIEISRDPRFSQIAIRQPMSLDAGGTVVMGLTAGDYHWRVHSYYPTKEIVGPSAAVGVDRAKELSVTPLNPISGYSVPETKSVRFNWETGRVVEHKVEFAFQIEKALGAGKLQPVLEKTQFNHSFEWKQPSRGVYRWRVVARIQGEKAGASDWRMLSIFDGKPIALRSPARDEKIEFWFRPPPFSFSWEDNAIVKRKKFNYQFLVARDLNFEQIHFSRKTQDPNVDAKRVELVPGHYFWKVNLLDQENNKLKTSQVGHFYYGHFPPLDPPEKVLPQDGEVLNLLMDEPVVSWSKIKDAKKYQVVISKDGKTVLKRVTKRSQLKLEGFKPGNYIWTVRAIDQINRQGKQTELRRFQLTYGDALDAPEIIDPLDAPQLAE